MQNNSSIFSLGIDPGWKNCGVALVKEEAGKIELVGSKTINVSELPDRVRAFRFVQAFATFPIVPLDFLTIERYVSYQNVNTAEAENILMFIGSIKEHLEAWMLKDEGATLLCRAIDWKTNLVKTLVKNKGFDNPSTSLDKKFSIAAAHACLDVPGTFNTDHEADAICLACFPLLRERYKPTKPSK